MDKNSKLSPSDPDSSPESWLLLLLLSTVSEDASEVLACVPYNHLDSYGVDTQQYITDRGIKWHATMLW